MTELTALSQPTVNISINRPDSSGRVSSLSTTNPNQQIFLDEQNNRSEPLISIEQREVSAQTSQVTFSSEQAEVNSNFSASQQSQQQEIQSLVARRDDIADQQQSLRQDQTEIQQQIQDLERLERSLGQQINQLRIGQLGSELDLTV
ncbi:MAG: hypothetical protein V2I33_05330 [Kangiellaceae bacterium]|jgi:hypothetical protein|nr:hypothetical protein [Kangiellaceae bacterium]